jgi:hypothetical protein
MYDIQLSGKAIRKMSINTPAVRSGIASSRARPTARKIRGVRKAAISRFRLSDRGHSCGVSGSCPV